MLQFYLSWMIEGSLFLSAILCFFSKSQVFIRNSSIFLLFSNIFCVAMLVQSTQSFSSPGIFFSLFGMGDVYYWDGLTAAMTLLNILATTLINLYQLCHLKDENTEYIPLLWGAFACVQGVFCSQHSILFYIFFEISIFPLSLWMLYDKTQEAEFCTKQFILYTCIGAAFFLIGLIICYTGIEEKSWNFIALSKSIVPGKQANLLSFCFLIPFLIKLPVWPFHGWLPVAHTQAPTEASVLLASVVLKIGGYGLLRMISLMGEQITAIYQPILIILGLFSLIFMSLSAFVQTDWKKLIAYSSIVHMAWVVIGVGLLIGQPVDSVMIYNGVIIQLISHGLISIALFFIIGMLSHRIHTRDIESYRGAAQILPCFAKYLTFFMLANIALPGTSGFVGEFMILIGLYEYSQAYAFIACASLLTTAIFNLKYFMPLQENFEEARWKRSQVSDCQWHEHAILGPLVICVICLGVSPQAVIQYISY